MPGIRGAEITADRVADGLGAGKALVPCLYVRVPGSQPAAAMWSRQLSWSCGAGLPDCHRRRAPVEALQDQAHGRVELRLLDRLVGQLVDLGFLHHG